MAGVPGLRLRACLAGVVALSLAHALLQLWQLTEGIRYVVSHLTIDDTYYYLQTAWLTKQLGFVTFDGLHATNGVQFLWFLVILALAILSPTKSILLFATLSICVLLNIACYAFIWRIGRRLGRPELAVWMAALWMTVSLDVPYSLGVENSLHALVFWWVIAQVLDFLMAVEKPGPAPSLLPVASALVVNAWVRLYGGFFSAVLYLGCIASLALRAAERGRFWQVHARALAVSLGLAAGGLAVQLVAFQMMGGWLLPISAIVKTSAFDPNSTGAPGILDSLRMSAPRYFPSLPVMALAAAVMAVLAAAWWRRPDADRAAFARLWAVLLVAFGGYHLVIYGFDISYAAYFTWYRSPLYLFWILTFAGPGLWLLHALDKRPAAALGLSLAVTSVLAAASIDRFTRFVERNEDRRTYLTDAYEAALWLSTHSKRETVFAAWNAGILGYFSDRTLINLDGLVNSFDYHERVLRNPNRLDATLAYLGEEKVDYVVDFVETAEARALTERLRSVRRFSPGKWEGWRMWRVRDDAIPLAEP
ncbi:MAG: hypothetical protein ACT4QD_05965 [Acidobacteriota bacterium]